MFDTGFAIKKVNARTMLPVASAGFSCLWAFLLLALLGPADAYGGFELSCVRIAFLGGVFVMLVAAHLKRDLMVNERFEWLPFAAVLCGAFAGMAQLAARVGMAFPLPAALLLWALAGCGFAVLFLEWAKVFTVSWRSDVNMFLGAAAMLSAVMYVFAFNMVSPFGDIAMMVLPGTSAAILYYVLACIVKADESPIEESEQTKLFLLTGFTLMLFGMLFGVGLYLVTQMQVHDFYGRALPVFVALAVVGGGGANVALRLCLKRHVALGVAERIALGLCTATFLTMALVDRSYWSLCALILVAVWTYLDFANIASLMGFASGHKMPFSRIARGQFVVVLGIGLGWALCLAASLIDAALLDFLPFLGIALVLSIALIAVAVPFQSNIFADKGADGRARRGGLQERRCQKAGEQYRLSEREVEILGYLAKGRNAQFVSEQLCISAYTVKTHIYHIYQKMGVNTRQDLITLVDSIEVEEW